MKKKLVAMLSTAVVSIMIGYLFVLSLLLGFLASKYVAGKSAGERGKISSIIVPFRRWRIHLHHWLYSLWLLGISFATGMYFLAPTATYGLLSGIAFQGIYCYGDWHIILVSSRGGRSTGAGRTAESDSNTEETLKVEQAEGR